MRYTIFETDLGWMGVLASDKGLRRMTIPVSTPEEAMHQLEGGLEGAELDPDFFGDFPDRVRRLFRGEEVDFPEKVDLPGATPFRRAVWEATRSIPKGETRSYGEIAAQVGRPAGARAVGQAMGSNPLAILIPCHRVIAGDGGLGGYGGHIEMKRRLLEVEGAIESGRGAQGQLM
ncbi:MAG: methylated-DNA--[protein]-cysteine S-methyltransferase [Dehalococcoidia bacterium]